MRSKTLFLIYGIYYIIVEVYYFLEMTISAIKIKILPVLKEAGVKHSALFGSAARGETGKNSDIDLLVQMKDSATLLHFVALKQNLEQTLGRKVDLLTFQSVNPKLKKFIEKDRIDIL